MSRRISAELLKLRTTRTTAGLVLGMLALVLFVVVIQLVATKIGGSDAPRLDEANNQRDIFTSASAAGLFAIIVGILSVTNEFRHGTIRPTLLFAPQRGALVVAKGVASAAAGAVMGLVSVAAAFAVVLVWLPASGNDRLLGTGDLLAIGAGCATATMLWAAIGLGFGAVVRNQVGAIVGTIVWSLIPEPLVQGLVPKIGRFTPGAAGDALSGATGSHLLSPLAGLAVLAGWTALFLAAGAVLTGRRDVP